MSLKSSARLKVVASPATTHCENWIQEGNRRIPSRVIKEYPPWLSKDSLPGYRRIPLWLSRNILLFPIKPKGLYPSTVLLLAVDKFNHKNPATPSFPCLALQWKSNWVIEAVPVSWRPVRSSKLPIWDIWRRAAVRTNYPWIGWALRYTNWVRGWGEVTGYRRRRWWWLTERRSQEVGRAGG